MIEPRGELYFLEEAFRPEARGQFGMQHLDRHRPAILAVVGQEYRRHAAAPEFPVDGVGLRQ